MSFDSKPMKPYEHPFGDPSHIMPVQMSDDLQKANATLMLGDVLLKNMVGEVERLKAQRDELLEVLELILHCDETGYIDGHGFINMEELMETVAKTIARAKGEKNV